MKKFTLSVLACLLSFSVNAGFVEGQEAFMRERYTEAMQQLRPLADNGDYRSQYYVAFMYIYGYGVARNEQMGLDYLKKSLEQNHDAAQALMGFLYNQGIAVPVDHKKAVTYYQKAADQGNTSALLNLGLAYYLGSGVPRNLSKAVDLLKKIPIDEKPEAGRYLGDMYLMMDDEENAALAIEAYRVAADAGDYASYNALAKLYLEGVYVEEDAERAVKYYTYAASRGYAPAQYALGMMYTNGTGVDRDVVLAHAWLSWAVTQNDEFAAQALAQLKPEMTLTDLDKARQAFIDIQQKVLDKVISPFEEEKRLLAEQEAAKPKRRPRRRR